MNDLFNIDDLSDSTGNRHFGGIIGLLVRALLALTTAGFFFTYGSQLFGWLVGPDYAGWVAALIGTFAIDGMAYVWPRLRESSATTGTQMTAAAIGTIGNMAISLLVTVIFIILRTTWVQLTDPAGTLTAAGWLVNLTGLACMTIGIAGNGALIAYYEYNSAQARDRRSQVEMDALKNQAASKLLRAQMELTIRNTLTQVGDQLPDVAQQAGRHNSSAFLRDRFAYLDNAPRHDELPTPPTPQAPPRPPVGQGVRPESQSSNGHGPGGNNGANF